MIVDINDGFWIDMGDDDPIVSLYMLGFTSQVTIMTTEFAKECKMRVNEYDLRKYVAIYEGCGITFSDMELAFENDFIDVPPSYPHPIIGLNDNMDALKKLSIHYLNELYHAYKPGKKDWEKKLKQEENVLSAIIDKYYNMFSIKNMLN